MYSLGRSSVSHSTFKLLALTMSEHYSWNPPPPQPNNVFSVLHSAGFTTLCLLDGPKALHLSFHLLSLGVIGIHPLIWVRNHGLQAIR